MSSGAVIDRVTPAACYASLQTDELRDEPVIVEKINRRAVHQRQEVKIDFRLGLFENFVIQTVLAELFARPLAGIAVAENLGDPETVKLLRELLHHHLRRERRTN